METEGESEMLIVEKILRKRFRRGKLEYLLKWRDFPDTYSMWEPEKNVICPVLISEFEMTWEENEKKRRAEWETRLRKRKAPTTPAVNNATTAKNGKLAEGGASTAVTSSGGGATSCPRKILVCFLNHEGVMSTQYFKPFFCYPRLIVVSGVKRFWHYAM